jgi:flagellar basal body-associated protein FliL
MLTKILIILLIIAVVLIVLFFVARYIITFVMLSKYAKQQKGQDKPLSNSSRKSINSQAYQNRINSNNRGPASKKQRRGK